MTRPKKDISKPCMLTLRVSEEELELINGYAQKADMSRSEYLRKVVLGKTPAVKYELVFNDPKILKIFSNLANITGNLNQIAHHLNAGRGWSDQLRSEVTEAIYEVREMRKELKELTGEYRGDC